MNPDAVVPNAPPALDPGNVRLAIVGEAPAVEEVSWRICSQGHGYAGEHWQNRQLVTRDRCPLCGSTKWTERPTPFVGESGRLLDELLKAAGLPRDRIFVGNCSRHPLREDEKNLEQCRNGLARLAVDIEDFEPNCVLCLGGLSLTAFNPKPDQKITNWRGSIFEGWLGNKPYKCVGGMHPAAILREPAGLALLREDVKRAVAESASPTLDLPQRVLDAPTSADEVCAKLRNIRSEKRAVGYDIEGTVDTDITVCSFATTPNLALSVPFYRMNFMRAWQPSDAERILRAVADVLEDPAVPKVCHNCSYEMFVHRWLHGHQIRNVEDTMLAWHVLYPELLKDLSVVASVLTKQPFWGTPDDWGVTDRAPTDADRDIYNGIDSMVTLECWQALQHEMTPAQRAYYEHSRALLEPCGEMAFQGLAYDAELRDDMVARIQREVFACQGKLDELAGIPAPTFREVVEAVAFKKAWDKCADWPDVLLHAKPSYR